MGLMLKWLDEILGRRKDKLIRTDPFRPCTLGEMVVIDLFLMDRSLAQTLPALYAKPLFPAPCASGTLQWGITQWGYNIVGNKLSGRKRLLFYWCILKERLGRMWAGKPVHWCLPRLSFWWLKSPLASLVSFTSSTFTLNFFFFKAISLQLLS